MVRQPRPPFSERVRIPFLIRLRKSNRPEHPLALRVEDIDVGRDLRHALLLCQLQQLQNALPPNMPVLIFLADNNREFAAVAQRNVPDQRAAVFDE